MTMDSWLCSVCLESSGLKGLGGLRRPCRQAGLPCFCSHVPSGLGAQFDSDGEIRETLVQTIMIGVRGLGVRVTTDAFQQIPVPGRSELQ